jgi:lipopolysaccharide export system permease protein
MFIFLLQFIMRYISSLAGKGLSGWVIIELISLNLAWMVVLAVPMSVLVATLMAYGNLSSSNEINAMKASGMSAYRMIAPSLVLSVIAALLLIYFNNEILPDANHRAKSLIIDIRHKKPTFTLQSGMFSNDIPGYSILVQKTFENSNELRGVKIYDYNHPESDVLITANKGIVFFTKDYRNLVMDLNNGEIHELDTKDFQHYRILQFTHHRIVMPVEGFAFERSGEGTFERGDRELSAAEMQARVDSLKKLITQLRLSIAEKMNKHFSELLDGKTQLHQLPLSFRNNIPGFRDEQIRFTAAMVENDIAQIGYYEEEADQFLVEIHKKYSIPVACIVFVLVGAPLGMLVRRGSFGISATLSLGFFLLYWSFLVGGEKFADRNIVSPFWGMWSANILLAVVGLFMILRISKSSATLRFSFLQNLFRKNHISPVLPS